MEIIDAIHSAINGNAILFLGTGFSIGATNMLGKTIPNVKTTCELLIEKGNLDVSADEEKDKVDLGYISDLFVEHNGEAKLAAFVKEQFSCRDFSETQKTILSLDWKRIYTTNYDDICECVSKNLGICRESINPETNASSVLKHRASIIHLNGEVSSVSPSNIQKHLKMSDTSYSHRTISDSEWARCLESSEAIIFVGYSLSYDIELKQIMTGVDEMKRKTIFVDLNPKPRQKREMTKYGNVFEEGSDSFAALILSEKSTFDPSKAEYRFKALSPFALSSSVPLVEKVDDKAIHNLLIYGNVEDRLILSASRKDYIFHRDLSNTIVNELTSNTNATIIHSDLGNGKTILLKEIGALLSSYGNVYFLKRNTGLQDDLDFLVDKHKLFFILIDDYNNFLMDNTFVDTLSSHLSPEMKLVFSGRSYINANLQSRLIDRVGFDSKSVTIHDINQLSIPESDCISTYLDRYAYWQSSAADSKSKKLKYINKTCSGQWRNILMNLLHSKDIQERIGVTINSLFEDNDVKSFILLTLICNIIPVRLSLSETLQLLNLRSTANILDNGEMKEFIDVKNNDVRIKSPLLSEYIISNYELNEDILDIILSILPELDKSQGIPNYKTLLRSIVSASNLKQTFNKKSTPAAKDCIIRVFETAKSLTYHKENPFFWLQYAIARMDLKDYDLAKIYLDTADSFAKKEAFDNWQIDVQRARYFLESTMVNSDAEHAFDNFQKADSLLYYCRTTSIVYPLKQASNYLRYCQKFVANLSTAERIIMHDRYERMLAKVNQCILDNNIQEAPREDNLHTIARNLGKALKILEST